jgi:hypothetical protein
VRSQLNARTLARAQASANKVSCGCARLASKRGMSAMRCGSVREGRVRGSACVDGNEIATIPQV